MLKRPPSVSLIHRNLVFFLFLFSHQLLAQNLISNGSFEDHNPIDCLYCHRYQIPFSYLTKGWAYLNSAPVLCDCDYEQNQGEKKYRACIEEVQAHHGCSMIQMGYFSNCMDFNHKNKGCADILARELTEPLNVGQVYEISFWVFIPKQNDIDPDYPSNIGVGLYEKKIRNPDGGMLSYPLLKLDTFVYDKWFLAKWYIRPVCSLQYFTLGVFRTENWPRIYTYSNYSPYFIDKIEVKKHTTDNNNVDINIANICRSSNKASEKVVVIESNIFYFSSNSDQLNEKQQAKLDSFAVLIKEHPSTTFTITGHTDNRGTNHTQLSQQRAEAILEYLFVRHKIPPFRFIPIFAGDTAPTLGNETITGREKNRRVEIHQSDFSLSSVLYRNLIIKIEKGDTNAAYKILFAWLNITKQEKKILMLFDPRIDILKNASRWQEINRRVRASYQQFKEPQLALFLDSLWAEDQKNRTLKYYIENLSAYLSYLDDGDKKWDVFFEEDDRISVLNDRNHFYRIDSLLRKNGWPKSSEVGNRAAKSVFLITTHSNDTLALDRYIPLLKARCTEGEAKWYWYATMYDRLKTLKDEPQRFGTQFSVKANNEKELFPLEDSTMVNVWRTEIGIPELKFN